MCVGTDSLCVRIQDSRYLFYTIWENQTILWLMATALPLSMVLNTDLWTKPGLLSFPCF